MSVLIKGMEMPQEGSWRTVRIYPDGTCAVPNWQGDCTLLKGVQAVELPSHGRLIDADALMEKFLETYTEYERKKLLVFYAAEVKQEVADMITDAPTIIPAEEGET